MSRDFIPVIWLTPEEFNKKVELAKILNRKIKIDYSINRVNLTIEKNNYANRYAVDLVNGEKPVISNKAWIAAIFKKTVPVITEGYGRREIPAPTFDMPGHTKILWDYLDPGNFSYINEEYILKKIKCYSYDLNSAYSFAMLKAPLCASLHHRCIRQSQHSQPARRRARLQRRSTCIQSLHYAWHIQYGPRNY